MSVPDGPLERPLHESLSSMDEFANHVLVRTSEWVTDQQESGEPSSTAASTTQLAMSPIQPVVDGAFSSSPMPPHPQLASVPAYVAQQQQPEQSEPTNNRMHHFHQLCSSPNGHTFQDTTPLVSWNAT